MACTISDYSIKFDEDNRIKSSINAKVDYVPTRLIIAASINSGIFHDWAYANNEAYKKAFDEKGSIAAINKNTLKSVIDKYADYIVHLERNGAEARTASALYGFTSANAKSIAYSEVGRMVKDKFFVELQKPKKEQRKRDDIINDVVKDIINELGRRTDIFIKELKEKGINNEDLQQYETLSKEIEETDNIIASTKASFNSETDLSKKQQLREQNKEAANKVRELKERRRALAYVIMTKYSTPENTGNWIQNKNYANLYLRVIANRAEFFDKVFSISKMLKYAKDFEGALESDKLQSDISEDDSDITNPGGENVDETTKSWENVLANSFLDEYGTRFKLYLDGLATCKTPYNKRKEGVQNDTFNELGVSTCRGSNYYITQLVNISNCVSVNSLIDSIKNAANTIPDLYALGALVDDMIANPIFANYVYTEIHQFKLKKAIITIGNNSIEFARSNSDSEVYANLFMQMLDEAKTSFKSAFNIVDNVKINKYLNPSFTAKIWEFDGSKEQKEIVNYIIYYIGKYFPSIDKQSIEKYLTNDKENSSSICNNMLRVIKDFNTAMSNFIAAYNESTLATNKEFKEYQEKVRASSEVVGGEVYVTEIEKPVYEFPENAYKGINVPVMTIARELSKSIAVKTELNHQNAEGHLSSDLTGNSFISNFLEQIRYTVEQTDNNEKREVIHKGLENLLEEVKLSKQFENNPILFGVKDINGNVIIPGLFIQNGLDYVVNPNAEKLFDVFLFDGVKESDKDGITYTKMSPSDYLISIIDAYHSVTDVYFESGEKAENTLANYFMRIPSDAPKNFTIQTIKVGMKDLTGINQEEYSKWKVDYYTELGRLLATNDKFMTFGEVPSNDTLIKNANAKIKNNQFNRNKVNAETIINILTNNGIYNISENVYQIRKRSNDSEIVDIPIVFNIEPTEYQRSIGEDGINITIILSGKSKNGFIEHAEVNSIYSYDSVLNTVGLSQRNVKRELIRFFESKEVDNYIYNYADELGLVNRSINRNSKGFAAFYQHLEQDIKTFVDQLHNVLEWSDEENAYISKLNIDGLFEFAHYKKGKTVEVGKDGVARFAGNLFQFTKLFDVNGVNGNNEISNSVSLYGGTNSIFTSFTDKDGNTRLKLSKPINDLFTINNNGNIDNHTAFQYVKTDEVTNKLSDIINKWLTEYTIALGETYNQYKELIPDSIVETVNRNRKIEEVFNKKELFLDAMLGQTWALMSFDDIFEGHSGFYKDAQTHLKRAKEVQMAGKSYAAQNKDIYRFGNINEIKGYNGQEIEIKVKQPGDIDGFVPTSYIVPTRTEKGIENKSMTVRDGFRGVTIRNTVRPYDLVEDLYRQLKENLSKQFDENTADDLANTIADGYRANAKLNDAQSYITFEEWIRRRHADGTLDEYQDLIEQLLDGSKPVEEIDLQGIAKRIQPQKNVYYDFQYDPVTKTVYPRQIKNSEFVLIPRLLPKDSDLRKLYDIMKRNDIGQINTAETDKAAKHYILEFWDKNSVAHPEEFEAAIRGQVLKDGKWTGQYNDKVIEKYYYRYLYKQQDVVDHIKDEENKAGIQIMKKIIDNASSASPAVREHVSNFEKAYAANIQDSFNKMLFNMGWQVDENGRLVNRPEHHKDPITGEVTTKQSPVLNFTEFWKKAKVEAQRLGMNSQFMEFLTPNELGNPNMPNWFSNVSVKIESIAQAIFNNQITRQTLPGWHAAQITQIGYSKELKYHPTVYSYIDDIGKKITINQEEYDKLSDEEKNKYTKIEEAYAEVYLPRWSNLIPKGKTKEEEERILKQIQKEGLDIQIGYRIPSEGKQSVSKLKVVGFLPDTYGSTIMLPDAWVIQTGSDFDIDSVYGIYYEMYRDKDGNVRKIQFDDLTNDTIERQHKRYLAYVNEQVNDRLKQDSKYAEANEYLKDVKNKLKSFDENITKSKEFGRLNKIIYDTENELKNSKDGKSVLKLINRIKKNFSKFGYSNFDISLEVIKELENSSPVEGIQPLVDTLIDAYKARVELDTLRKNNDPYSESLFNYKTKNVIEKKQAAIEDYFRIVNEVAKDLGLYSFEDFIELPAEMQNTRKARNNRILDSMVGIMSDPSSLEENLSRSNFDDITEEKKVLEEMAGVSLSSMSVYNPVHQVKFMENAINGRKLKAFSVTRDTFNSVNNRIHTNVNPHEAPIVKYSKKYYNPEVIKAAYDNVEEYDNYLIVKHDKIGWSNNNKNILGKYVTVYSSETTAHILDAIKEGALYNETDFTFGTFKTLVDVGIDYRTAIGFLMQPAITLINDKYFSTKSIYTNATGYPINMAFAEVLNKLGVRYKDKEITQYTDLVAVLSSIPVESDITETLIKYFGGSILGKKGLSNGMGVLDREVLEKRLKANKTDNIFSSEREKDIFDLGILIMFKQFYYTTKGIEKIQRLTNPDSFGALQTVNETRTKVNNARALYGFPRTTDGTPKIDQPLYVGDFFYPSTVLEAIYPGLDGDNIRVEHSRYPSLAAMFKYSTMTSVEANSKVFTLESNEFAAIYNIIQAKLGIEFKQEQYRELQKYIVSDIFNNIPILSSPVTINEHGFIIINEEVITSEENTAYWNDEKARIFGYKETIDNFKVNDINNPTPEELKEYVKLTPLQKVRFMQSNFNDDNVNALFSKLRTRIITKADKNSKGYGKNIIRFNDSADNIEDIFVFFRNCFFNKNPLIKLAAIDLVKYSFIVDGHKFAKGSISKFITNDALLANINNKGMNIVDVANKQMYTNISKSYYTDDYFIDKFVRSHSEFVNNVYLPRNKVNGISIYQQFNMCKQQNGLVFIPSIDEFKYLMDAIRSRGSYKEYIKITDTNKGRKTETLYKIVTNESYKGLYLVPLNLLEDNEIADYSLNPVNNKFPNQDYYYNILSKIDNNIADLSELNISARKSAENKLASEVARKDYIVPNKKPKPTKHETLVQDTSLIDALVDDRTPALEKAKLQKLVDDVNKRYESTSIGTSIAKDGTKSFLVWSESDTLAFNIPEKGKDRSIIQRIEVGGISVPFKISKYKFIRNGREVGNLFNKKAEGKEVVFTEQEIALSNELSMAGNPINARIYKVEEQIDPSVLQEYIDTLESDILEDVYENNSIIEDIADLTKTPILPTDEYSNIDRVSSDIINDINRQAVYENDLNAQSFGTKMKIKNINTKSLKSLSEHKQDVYSLAAKYYTKTAKEIKNEIESFKLSNGEIFSIGDKELYKVIKDYPEDYQRLLKTILKAKYFGANIAPLFKLDVTTEEPYIKNAINDIINVINSIQTDNNISKAFDFLFNEYLANEYSRNPNFRIGISDITTAWNDTDWFDLNISDIRDLNNKQVQLIVKIVSSLVAASGYKAKEVQDEFRDGLKTLMSTSGTFNWDNIITPNGKFVRPFNDSFFEDKAELEDKVIDARLDYEDALSTGDESKIINSAVVFQKARLVRDKWRRDNLEQRVVRDYYVKEIAAREKIIEIAPVEYSQYTRLQELIYGKYGDERYLTAEDIKEKQRLIEELESLISLINSDGTEKDKDLLKKVYALNLFIQTKRELNKEYFEYSEDEEFIKAAQSHYDIILRHKRLHPDQTLEERLTDNDFRESYEWLKGNTIVRMNKETREKVKKAFSALKSKDALPLSNPLNPLFKIYNTIPANERYDIFGNLIGTNFTEEQCKEIRDITIKNLNPLSTDRNRVANDHILSDNNLLKDIPNDLPVFSDKFYSSFRTDKEKSREYIVERRELYTEINNLIQYGIDEHGHLDTNLLFTNLSKEQLKELSELYLKLSFLEESGRKHREKEFGKAKNFIFDTNDKAFNEEFNKYQKLSATEKIIWERIFIDLDTNTGFPRKVKGKYVPNKFIYGYIRPARTRNGQWVNPEYIDLEKTEAKRFIKENITFETTEYYDAAAKKAQDEGRFKEWYDNNHYYNPNNRRMEPIKIWTKMVINPNSELSSEYDFIPTNDNVEKTVKDEYKNPKFNQTVGNFNDVNAEAKYKNSTYDTLSIKERNVLNYLIKTVNTNVSETNGIKKFFEKGYVPRKAVQQVTGKWIAKEMLGAVGFDYKNHSDDTWHDELSYNKDFEAKFDMANLIRTKGTKKEEVIPEREYGESDKHYRERIKPILELNKKIREDNLKLDNVVMSKNWEDVFTEFVGRITEYNEKQKLKNLAYVTLADLRNRESYKVNSFGRLKKEKNSTTEEKNYTKISQSNTVTLVENYFRRILFDEYKQIDPKTSIAEVLQNMTSAKYMIFNVTGGIVNVGTGLVNMVGEMFAGEHFSKESFGKGMALYTSNALTTLADLYSVKSTSLPVAIMKLMKIVDINAMIERKSDENIVEYANRFKDALYGLQSSGEHFMQNSVMLAMMQDNRIFTDINGRKTTGSFVEYTSGIEYLALQEVIRDKPEYLAKLNLIKNEIFKDKEIQRKYDTFQNNIVDTFIRSFINKEERDKILNAYLEKYKEYSKNAKEEFEQLPTVYEQFELRDGEARLKKDSVLSPNMLGEFKEKVFTVNNKIHGVYDKIGGARIESMWWGGLVMQYHKHIYNGIMKRWRRHGYFNEITGTTRKGSYVSLFDFITKEYKNIRDRKEIYKHSDPNQMAAITSMRVLIDATYDTFVNLKFNWKILPDWEKRNIRRVLGDLLGIGSAMFFAMCIYMASDDDELEENNTLAMALNIFNRLFNESQMYTPWGLVTEAKTMWSSPTAFQNSITDLLKCIELAIKWMFDGDFDIEYSTGLYAGKNKLGVRLIRNIPLYRVIENIRGSARHNSYYRINETSYGMGVAKNIADYITE